MKKLKLIPIKLTRNILVGDVVLKIKQNSAHNTRVGEYKISNIVNFQHCWQPIQIILCDETVEIKEGDCFMANDYIYKTDHYAFNKSPNSKKIIASNLPLEGVYGILPEQLPLIVKMLNEGTTECQVEMEDAYGSDVIIMLAEAYKKGTL